MRKKRMTLIVLASMLIFPSFLVATAQNESSPVNVVASSEKGEFRSKDEVVYATLSANGELEDIYVVNSLDVRKAGLISDFGNYSSVKNLTDLSEIEQAENTVNFVAPKGKFYYQGNMNSDNKLPWNISISYFLDGKSIAAEELAGKDGKTRIHIKTTANDQVNPVFYENYLLQITLTLDPIIFNNMEISDGMVANAGKNKQLTYTVMPGQEGEFSLLADVEDFALDGIQIAGVPSSMSIDVPDIDEMTEDMKTLSEAIKELNDGVAELKSGVYQLNDGVISLRDGSEQYKSGVSQLDAGSDDLIDASKSINEALSSISSSLNQSGEIDLGELKNLPAGLLQISQGLNDIAVGMVILKENYSVAYQTLDGVILGIPSHTISEQDIQQLYGSGANSSVLDKLVETYAAAQTAKQTYLAVKQGFEAVDGTLAEISGSIKMMGNTLGSIATELQESLSNMDDLSSFSQLQDGIAQLSTSYSEFHYGLVSYAGGVGQIANSYNKLHAGIVELSDGTSELADGVEELHSATKKLEEATSDLPTQMQEEIDKMIADYDKTDFEAVSFVSSANEKINLVQFVFKTEKIKKEELKNEAIQEVEVKGFWDKLKDLFAKK